MFLRLAKFIPVAVHSDSTNVYNINPFTKNYKGSAASLVVHTHTHTHSHMHIHIHTSSTQYPRTRTERACVCIRNKENTSPTLESAVMKLFSGGLPVGVQQRDSPHSCRGCGSASTVNPIF